jgi:lipoic acid synthetase
VEAIKSITGAEVEVLVPDFGGDTGAVDTVLASHPMVFNHNVETVPRLYPTVRPIADYKRSLLVLEHAAHTGAVTKSGIMVGFGETESEVLAVLTDLRAAGVKYVTIGQYLAPSGAQLPIADFIRPETFDKYARTAREMGFSGVASSPFVRSSYHAASLAGRDPSGTMQ